jgi:TolA-binding protein
MTRWGVYGLFSVAALVFSARTVQAGPLDEMDVERWKKLKEAEFYQLKIAEKFYGERHYKVAADEYEKFLKLYDRSEGAPFAQLKWSHCQVELRKLNAAIKDGYQSVLDYYPDSPDAPIASLLIGRTYVSSGDTKLAKKAFTKTISTYPKHFAAVMSRFDLVDIAKKENDVNTQTALLRQLTFEVERKGATVEPCVNAARQLAHLEFQAGNFDAGLKAMETTCPPESLPVHLMHGSLGALAHFISTLTTAKEDSTKKLGEKLADDAAKWFKERALEKIKDEKTKKWATDTWYASAEVRYWAHQPEKQKVVLDEIGAAVGQDDDWREKLARWYINNKQMEKARLEYGKFKDPVRGKGLVASSYLEENQFDKAAAEYLALSGTDPKATDVKVQAQWKWAAAMAYRRGGKPDPAILIYTELSTKDTSGQYDYFLAIADTHYYANRWKECLPAYRQVKGNEAHVYMHMARANRNLKQHQEAINLYRQLIALASDKNTAGSAQYEVGMTYEEWDEAHKEDAIKAFKTVCDKYPTTASGSQAHAHLNDKYKITVTLGGAKN